MSMIPFKGWLVAKEDPSVSGFTSKGDLFRGPEPGANCKQNHSLWPQPLGQGRMAYSRRPHGGRKWGAAAAAWLRAPSCGLAAVRTRSLESLPLTPQRVCPIGNFSWNTFRACEGRESKEKKENRKLRFLSLFPWFHHNHHWETRPITNAQ